TEDSPHRVHSSPHPYFATGLFSRRRQLLNKRSRFRRLFAVYTGLVLSGISFYPHTQSQKRSGKDDHYNCHGIHCCSSYKSLLDHSTQILFRRTLPPPAVSRIEPDARADSSSRPKERPIRCR